MGDASRAMLKDSSVFSMANVRGVVDRMVSGFFYTAPHSPDCAQKDVVVSGTELSHSKSCRVLIGGILA